MRRVAVNDAKPLKLTDKVFARLKQWLNRTHDPAKMGRTGLETTWRSAMRMYNGLPEAKRWAPFDNAPHIEVTVGAQCADAVYAQACDLIFQSNPYLTARSRKGDADDIADIVQEFIDWGCGSGKWGIKPAIKNFLLDDVQLGTGVFYCPWTHTVRKTDVSKVEDFGPRLDCIDLSHFLLPPNADQDLEKPEFVTMWHLFSKEQARLEGNQQGWKLDDENAVANESDLSKDRRKIIGINDDDAGQKGIKIGYTWGHFDVDGDGIAEDIEVVWNMVTYNPLKLTWARYDCRPFVMRSYQDRAHVPFGIGVMEMTSNYEQEATEIRNNRVWNMMMRNQMLFTGPEAAMPEIKELYNGKYISSDQGEVKVLPMGEPDNQPVQAEMISMTNAQQRVGVNELNASSRLGGRTPGITALSALQQANRRFTPAFDNMREAIAGAVIQCLYRYQEQVRANNKAVISQLGDVLGDEKADKLVEFFKKDEFELHDALDIQLTASSVSVNREADRQNMIMLEQIWEKYIQLMTAFAQAKSTPPFHGAETESQKAAEALNKLMTKILKTFDQVSDVEGFLIDLDSIPAGVVMPPALQQMVGAGNGPAAQQIAGGQQGPPQAPNG